MFCIWSLLSAEFNKPQQAASHTHFHTLNEEKAAQWGLNDDKNFYCCTALPCIFSVPPENLSYFCFNHFSLRLTVKPQVSDEERTTHKLFSPSATRCKRKRKLGCRKCPVLIPNLTHVSGETGSEKQFRNVVNCLPSLQKPAGIMKSPSSAQSWCVTLVDLVQSVPVHMRVEYQGWISYSILIINKERVKSCYMGWS